jgi:hypothetical protein
MNQLGEIKKGVAVKIKLCFSLMGFVAAVLVCANPLSVWAQTEDIQEDRVADAIEQEKGRTLTPAEELIELLKRRALRKAEKERRKQLWTTKGTIGMHIGYNNNVNTNSDRRGDFYNEQYFSFSWTPTFSDYLAAEIGTWYFTDWYFDNRDTTLVDNAFNASLKWYPLGDPNLEFQPGVERSYAYYPYSDTSTYVEDKAFVKFKHRFWKRWTQDGKYEYSFKEYDTKNPRTEENSTAYIYGMVLEKSRHTAEYNLALPAILKNNLKIKQKAYMESSNDKYRNDYYDVYSYKLTGECGRSLAKKLYSKVSSAFERKNYKSRTVAGANLAQYDDVYTHKAMFYYTLKKGWTLSYTVTYTKTDSNYVVYDYDSLSHVAGIYISF